MTNNAIVIAATGGKTLWYLSRGSGIVTLLLLTISFALGILNVQRWKPRRTPRFVVQDVHRNVSLLILVFLGIHITSVIMDGYVSIGWLDAVLPFHAGYKPLWVGLGALVVDLLLAIIITSLLRHIIGRRAWRTIHWLAYAMWPIAIAHSLGSGSDASQLWMLGFDAALLLLMIGFISWRFFSPPSTALQQRQS